MRLIRRVVNLFVDNILVYSLFFLLLSCEKQEKEIILTLKSPSDFVDALTVDGTVQAVRSASLACPRGIEAEIVFMVEDGSLVEQGDEVCVLESRELVNDYEQVLTDVETARANLNKTRADLDMQFAMLDAQVKSIVAQTSIVNLDSLQLKYASPVQRRIKELEIEKAAIEKNKLERKLSALKTINNSQIRSLEIQILRKENQAASMKERIDMLTLKAPQTGMAVRANSWLTGKKLQEGDQVWSNMPLVSIPDLSEMKVVIEASEASYKRISLNDPVEFSFDAMPDNRAWGKIQKIAPVGRPIKEKSQVKIFEIEASIDSFQKLPEPGLTANCKVVIHRVRNTIVVPQIAIFEQDSAKYVYVKLEKGYEKRQVLTGISSPKEAVITAGLKGKESISLIKPSTSKIKKTMLLPSAKKKKIPVKQSRNTLLSPKPQSKQIHSK